MPYPGVAEEDVPKVERCVQKVMKTGKAKSNAIAICVASIKGEAHLLNLEAATEADMLALQAELEGAPDILKAQAADLPTNTLLKFENACLARAEINANGDGITTEGIEQLASTIRLMPITLEHEKQPRGIFTRGNVGGEQKDECLVSGFVWAGHFPEFAEEIRTGVRKLSVDAEAKFGVCSVCGEVFSNHGEYCEHILGRKEGAVRWLHDLTAVAGGAVLSPAGTDTVFPGREGLTIICGWGQDDLSLAAEWWRKHWKTEGEIPTSKFADKKNRKYPFLNPSGGVDKDGWMAAWKYAHAHGASGVIAVLKKHLPKGYKLDGDSVTKVQGGSTMKVLCPECGHEHEITTEAERLQSELDQALSNLQQVQDQLTQVQADLQGQKETTEQVQAELEVERTVVGRYVELASEAGLEVAAEALPSLRKVDDDVFATLKSMASRAKAEEETTDETTPDIPPKPKVPVSASKPPNAGSEEDTWTFES